MAVMQAFSSKLVTVACCLPDINELSLPKTCTVEFPDSDDLLNFKLVISPDEVSCCYLVHFNGSPYCLNT